MADADSKRFMHTDEVAAMLHTTVKTVEYWRYTRTGPPGIRVGRRVLYDRGDVEVWLHERAQAEVVPA